jgi:hypothetical protein
MAKLIIALFLLVSGLPDGDGPTASAVARTKTGIAAPPEKKPEQEPRTPSASTPTCRLLTPDVPRGGRLEVEGEHFGKAPLVRIAGRVTRMIERFENRIAVQVHADSDGGSVTLKAGSHEVECGTLSIIGKN